MDKSVFDKYINEMKKMSKKAIPTVSETVPDSQMPSADLSGTGYLLVNVTSVRGLYPVQNAKVTVFEGNLNNMQTVAEGFTNESGKTEVFPLPTPPAAIAQESDSKILPYKTYSILTEADAFVKTVFYNAPVFDKVTSIQNVNLIPKTVIDEDDDTIVVDEYEDYSL